MPPLGLDFVRRRARSTALGWVLLVAGLASIAVAGLDYVDAHDELRAARERVEVQARLATSGARRAAPTVPPDVVNAVARVDAALARPWGPWLGELESLAGAPVAMLGIEAQGAARSWRLTAEAAGMDDVVDYVERLRRSPRAQSVVLSAHETRAEGAERLIRFTVEVTWRSDS